MVEEGFWQAFAGGGVTGVLGFLGVMATTKGTRESRFHERIDKELDELRVEVAECRKERPQMAILKMGVGMMASEVQRLDPNNPTLKQVASAFSALPKDNNDSLDELLRKLEQVPGTEAGDGEDR